MSIYNNWFKWLFFSYFFIASTISYTQSKYLVGFQKEISGFNFTYHSPYSNNQKSLLSRANKNFPAIEWETEKVSTSYKKKNISFIWLYGIDVLPDTQKFKLFANGKHLLTFSSPIDNKKELIKVKGINGSSLTLNRSMIDKHNDQMGYAVLTIPTEMIKKGASVKIKVDGVDNHSNAWFMTYKLPLKDGYNVSQIKAVKKVNNQLFHILRFNIIHLAKPSTTTISINDRTKKFNLKTGLNEFDFLVPKVLKPTTLNAKIIINKKSQEKLVTIKPIKEWTIHLVQHSHTDIGYTRPQSEILAEHLRYIDDALDYCDITDHYPDNAKFRWTCEAAWTVREYLKSRPKQQINRLLKRIKEGRIEVTGMFFNFSEIVDETALAIQAKTLTQFKKHGINVKTLMQNDVNGIGWCLIDYYYNTGVKYLTMGQHGHRARIPFNKPTSFWWESPSGKKLLAYRSEHYMHGNELSLTSGKIDVFGKNLSQYLAKLEEKNYPLNRISLQFSGYVTDNSPPSTKACDIVKEWNKKYEWPKLKLSLASEFMIHLEKSNSVKLSTKKVAWPDWWTDGFGSAMNETKTSRKTHSNMIATTGLLALAQAKGAKVSSELLSEINQCYDNLLFYDEHTFGAAESIRDPNSENSINQWRQKLSYVWSANQQSNLLREKVIGLIEPYIKKTKKPSITIFNTLNWKRSGIAEVFIDHDILPIDKAYQIVDKNGNKIPTQIIKSRSEGSYWALWLKDVPPMGYTTCFIISTDTPLQKKQQRKTTSNVFENNYYKVVISSKQKGIVSLIDKETNKELVDKNSKHKLGNLIYETLDNRTQLERLTYLNRDTLYKPLDKKLTQLSNFKFSQLKDGEIWKSVIFKGTLPNCADDSKGVTIELRMYHHTKKIKLLYNMTKLANTNPEGLYVAFPFSKGKLAFEAQGGVVYPGKNQLEGTASDWNTIQNFASVIGNNSQIVFSSNDIPLAQFGEINTGRYYYKYLPKKSHIYSWVLNNYWTTNFRASQEGELNWSYNLTSSTNNSLSFATRFGVENKIPMIARANFGNAKKDISLSNTIIDLNQQKNLLLVNARPSSDGKGIILHLRETEGDHAILDVTKLLQNKNIVSVTEVNVLEEKIKKLEAPLLIEHFETKFILLQLN
ncbi:MAG: glycosyl hydrolase family 38 [Flavobacteriaceae bacterium]|nr:glycosyl hydrolase family 38 [Flavobacteriaceae bacterium]